MTEDYEVIPHQLLSELKEEVESLKKKLTQPDAKANELILEIESMKDSVHELTVVFQKALEEIKDEGDSTSNLRNIKEKLETLVRQNETIAKGILTISEKIDIHPSVSQGMQSPSSGMSQRPLHSMTPPTLGGSRTAPMPTAGSHDEIPPPPPRRKGMF